MGDIRVTCGNEGYGGDNIKVTNLETGALSNTRTV